MPELSIGQSALLTDLTLCCNRYRLFTPGMYLCVHVPVILDDDTRFVPGLVAQFNHGRQKQCEPKSEAFVGPPNFVLDVFDPGDEGEYEIRKAAFARGGVTEYVALFDGNAIRWHWHRQNGCDFESISPDTSGIIKSKSMPGFWFSIPHLQNRDWWGMLGVIERGVSRLGHHEVMETVWHKDGRDPASKDPLPFESG